MMQGNVDVHGASETAGIGLLQNTTVCFSFFPWFVADCTVMKLRGRRGLRGLAALLHARR
jgi:hypothetical protein